MLTLVLSCHWTHGVAPDADMCGLLYLDNIAYVSKVVFFVFTSVWHLGVFQVALIPISFILGSG